MGIEEAVTDLCMHRLRKKNKVVSACVSSLLQCLNSMTYKGAGITYICRIMNKTTQKQKNLQIQNFTSLSNIASVQQQRKNASFLL